MPPLFSAGNSPPSLHRDYAYGVGLHATIDAPFLTIDAVNAFIDRFMKLEADYRDPEPRSYQHDEISHWGLESNALDRPMGMGRGDAGLTEHSVLARILTIRANTDILLAR